MLIKHSTHLYPVKMFSNVDLPAPEGPIIAVSSPERSRPLTLFRIVLSSAEREIFYVNHHYNYSLRTAVYRESATLSDNNL